MTTSTVTVQDTAHPDLAHAAWIADLVDHAAIDVAPRGLSKVTDAGPLDREDAGKWLSGLLDREIEHRHSASEHLFVDVTTHRAVRLVLFRRDNGVPMFYMAQSPGTGTGTGADLYSQFVDAARSAPGPGAS
ncbi:hypothetical protein NQK81_01950 [Amycolatopsis roodepoortensis]|uniref:hypothetical protein n=1 Tax=Amycolatopsis roodepoortensis TaxID=700274 RepID=UPI00214ABE1F|nr:hypothetical protein [Amycolatopsis roodepoortensis]UUV32238.1 hypothetical protein NQK81_01950 [Amycolatopsis roodepoortensis]